MKNSYHALHFFFSFPMVHHCRPSSILERSLTGAFDAHTKHTRNDGKWNI